MWVMRCKQKDEFVKVEANLKPQNVYIQSRTRQGIGLSRPARVRDSLRQDSLKLYSASEKLAICENCRDDAYEVGCLKLTKIKMDCLRHAVMICREGSLKARVLSLEI